MTLKQATDADFDLRLHSLRSATLRDQLEAASFDMNIAQIETRMLLHRYSQLPVFDTSNACNIRSRNGFQGLVSWQSIARARVRTPEPEITDVVVPAVVLDLNAELFSSLPAILDAEIAFIADENNICGIVTPHDIIMHLCGRAEQFFLMCGIEQALSRSVAALQDRTSSEATKIAMNDLIERLSTDWETIDTNLSKEEVIGALDKCRKLRNDLMHARSVDKF